MLCREIRDECRIRGDVARRRHARQALTVRELDRYRLWIHVQRSHASRIDEREDFTERNLARRSWSRSCADDGQADARQNGEKDEQHHARR